MEATKWASMGAVAVVGDTIVAVGRIEGDVELAGNTRRYGTMTGFVVAYAATGKPMWFGIGPGGQAVFALPGNGAPRPQARRRSHARARPQHSPRSDASQRTHARVSPAARSPLALDRRARVETPLTRTRSRAASRERLRPRAESPPLFAASV